MTYSEKVKPGSERRYEKNGYSKLSVFIVFLPALLLVVLSLTILAHGFQPVSGETVSEGFKVIPEEVKDNGTQRIDYPEDTEEIPIEKAPAYSEKDVVLIARTLYGEANGVQSDMEVAAVAWCILNRVDTTGYACGHSIEYVVTYPQQFHGYRSENPVTERLYDIAKDVLERWSAEKDGAEDSGRVLPKEYIYFVGDGRHNHFAKEYKSRDYFDWSLPNPYED